MSVLQPGCPSLSNHENCLDDALCLPQQFEIKSCVPVSSRQAGSPVLYICQGCVQPLNIGHDITREGLQSIQQIFVVL